MKFFASVFSPANILTVIATDLKKKQENYKGRWIYGFDKSILHFLGTD